MEPILLKILEITTADHSTKHLHASLYRKLDYISLASLS